MDAINIRNVASIASLIAISCYLLWRLPSLVPFSISSPAPLHSTNFSSPQSSVVVPDVKYTQYAPPSPDRLSDITDTFKGYRKGPECHISSLDLHVPFSPLCPDRASVLEAMSNGGRVGFDAPYMPRGCDMRWYTSEEACEILGRFHRVVIVGDSFMRHVTNALWVLIRADLEHGAIHEQLTDTLPEQFAELCHCHNQFAFKTCSMLLYRKAQEAFDLIPEKLVCEPGSFDLHYYDGDKWPISHTFLDPILAAFPKTKPSKPVAMLFDHSLHNNANLTVTKWYMDSIVNAMHSAIPWFSGPDARKYLPKLYFSSNSGQWQKERGMERQNMNNIAKFEREAKPLVESRGFEFLGAWNMSITATAFDGLHSTLEGNLLKAMMFLNWLDNLDQPETVDTIDQYNDTPDVDETLEIDNSSESDDNVAELEDTLNADDNVAELDDTLNANDNSEIADPSNPADPSAVLPGTRRRGRFRRNMPAKVV